MSLDDFIYSDLWKWCKSKNYFPNSTDYNDGEKILDQWIKSRSDSSEYVVDKDLIKNFMNSDKSGFTKVACCYMQEKDSSMISQKIKTYFCNETVCDSNCNITSENCTTYKNDWCTKNGLPLSPANLMCGCFEGAIYDKKC